MAEMYDELTQYIVENQNRFYRLAYSYVKEEQAALDVVQNAVMKALEHESGLRSWEYMGTWLYRIVINESINYLRRNARETLCSEEILIDAAQSEKLREDAQYGDPEKIVTQNGQELYEAILALPETMQTVIKLYYFEELTMPQIAKITQVRLSTVKYRLYQGLKKLKIAIKEGVA